MVRRRLIHREGGGGEKDLQTRKCLSTIPGPVDKDGLTAGWQGPSVEPRGIEPLTQAAEREARQPLAASRPERLAHSLAREAPIDPDLTRIAAAWPALPEPIRRAVLALVDSAALDLKTP